MNIHEKFMRIQCKYFDDAKFFEGINRKSDPGEEFIINFIQTSASKLRKDWNSSCCKHCNRWFECGHLLKKECNRFKFDEKENEDE